MKSVILPLFLAAGLLSSCDANFTTSVSETKTEDTTIQSVPTISGQHCYAYTSDKDSIFMTVDINNKSASGTLVYKLSEKDKNEGTFTGTMNADTLFATYHFSSEGVMSDRKIIFVLNDSKAVEVFYHDVIEGKTVRYKSQKELSLEHIFALSKQNCKD